MLLLYDERHDDGRSFTSMVDGDADGLLILNVSVDAEGIVKRWGRTFDATQTATIVALFDGDAAQAADPARFLHQTAAFGGLPTDQPLDAWLAEHGIVGTTADVD